MKNKTLVLYFIMLSLIISIQGCAPALVAGAAATGVALGHDRRTAGTIVEDKSIEFKVADQINSDKKLAEQVHITVTSYNGTVLLTGEAPKAELQTRIVNIASNVDKVKRVVNAIQITTPTTLPSRNNDTWITSKVKTRLLGTRDVDGTLVKVLTENGSVYLMGLVTYKEADTATDIAKNVDGIKRVVKVFEYIE